jgi:hypothetical protein
MTDKQKHTISTLKKAYKEINSGEKEVGVFLDINTILSSNQNGRDLIKEINLHNDAIKGTYIDSLKSFKEKADGDFNKLGWYLTLVKDTLTISLKSSEIIGKLLIMSEYAPYENINGHNFQRILRPIYSIRIYKSSLDSYSSVNGFKELLQSDGVKKAVLKAYNLHN